jgi:hypothetical protein
MQPNALLIRQNFIVVKSGCYKGFQHFPSLHQTLSHKDLEEIGMGINTVSNKRLNGYNNGFGSG